MAKVEEIGKKIRIEINPEFIIEAELYPNNEISLINPNKYHNNFMFNHSKIETLYNFVEAIKIVISMAEKKETKEKEVKKDG